MLGIADSTGQAAGIHFILEQKILRPQLDATLRQLVVFMTGDHHYRGLLSGRFIEAAQYFQAIGIGQHIVEQYAVETLLAGELQATLAQLASITLNASDD